MKIENDDCEIIDFNIIDATHRYFEYDLISYCTLVFYKPNRRKFCLTQRKQASVLQMTLLMLIFQAMLIYCLIKYINEEVIDLYIQSIKDQDFLLFLTKWICTVAMHLEICTYFVGGMTIMKFVTNHPEEFDQPEVSYLLGTFQVINCLIFEVCNVFILFSRNNVYFTLGCYITVGLILNLSKMYLMVMYSDRSNLLC